MRAVGWLEILSATAGSVVTVGSVGSVLRWVVGQVEEQTDVVHGAVLLKVRLEESSGFHVDLEETQK